MCEHGRGLDGRTVARGRHRRQAVQARLGRRRGGQTGKPTAQIEPVRYNNTRYDGTDSPLGAGHSNANVPRRPEEARYSLSLVLRTLGTYSPR